MAPEHRPEVVRVVSWLVSVSGTVWALFALHFAATIAFQFRTFSDRWPNLPLRWLLDAVIPRWTFFAPRPGTFDFYLLARLRDESGKVGSWRNILSPERRGTRVCKRERKILIDVCAALAKQEVGRYPARMLSTEYLLVLNLASAHFEAGGAVQVSLLASDSAQPDLVPVFLSGWHRIDSVSGA